MTQESLDRIRRSFVLLSPHLAKMAEVFYDRLFATLPESRTLFRVDMEMQKQHFAAALALIVRNIFMLDALDGPLRQLGADHARAGVKPRHYPPVRDAMLYAVGSALGGAWTEELASDWHRLIDTIAVSMLAGSHA